MNLAEYKGKNVTVLIGIAQSYSGIVTQATDSCIYLQLQNGTELYFHKTEIRYIKIR